MVTFQSCLDIQLVCSNFPRSEYQSAERVSVRLAARAMQPTPAMLQQHRGQPQPMYLPPHLNHLAFAAIPFMMPPPTMPKRALESEDDSSAPKSKRAKAKAKPAEGNGS